MCPVTETIFFFFFNDTATTEIYTLSLHDALPICKPFTTEAAMGKLFASEAACRAAAHGVQIHGGCGFTPGVLVEGIYPDVQPCTIGEGKSGGAPAGIAPDPP